MNPGDPRAAGRTPSRVTLPASGVYAWCFAVGLRDFRDEVRLEARGALETGVEIESSTLPLVWYIGPAWIACTRGTLTRDIVSPGASSARSPCVPALRSQVPPSSPSRLTPSPPSPTTARYEKGEFRSLLAVTRFILPNVADSCSCPDQVRLHETSRSSPNRTSGIRPSQSPARRCCLHCPRLHGREVGNASLAHGSLDGVRAA